MGEQVSFTDQEHIAGGNTSLWGGVNRSKPECLSCEDAVVGWASVRVGENVSRAESKGGEIEA